MQAATAPRNSSVSLVAWGVGHSGLSSGSEQAQYAHAGYDTRVLKNTQDDEYAAGALSVAAPSLTRAPQGQGAHRTSIPLPTLSRLARRARS